MDTIKIKPQVSQHFSTKKPSGIRMGHIKYLERTDEVALVNGAMGNVSIPMYHVLRRRMSELTSLESPFADGVVKYSGTAGTPEAQEAFKNILKCQGFNTDQMEVLVTDGGSTAMEIMMLGVCGDAGQKEKPLMMVDPSFTNYNAFASRLGRTTVSVGRLLSQDGNFTFPSMDKVEEEILRTNPGALLVIPYDNPTGQLYDYEILKDLAALCVKHNMWLVSDEAYRELFYDESKELVSIWGLSDDDVPGIEGRRISIETSSKVWNACGLRIGALVTDNKEFQQKAVAEYTANLCANVIGQHIFGALAHETKEDLDSWFKAIRSYYRGIMHKLYNELRAKAPGFIISNPDASIYFVVDLRNVVDESFDASEFIMYCAQKGKVSINGQETTLLTAPMKGFYNNYSEKENPGRTQIRISFCEPPEKLALIPELLVKLLADYLATK